MNRRQVIPQNDGSTGSASTGEPMAPATKTVATATAGGSVSH